MVFGRLTNITRDTSDMCELGIGSFSAVGTPVHVNLSFVLSDPTVFSTWFRKDLSFYPINKWIPFKLVHMT
jgi:hypothetical protein